MSNNSPWFHFERPTWPSLKTDLSSEVAIVGGGISGIATLYRLLTSTSKKVVLFEKNKVASGATGHNAGLAIVHIEKSATELVSMLGKEAVEAIFTELDEAWDELHDIHDKIGLKDNLLSFPQVANGFNSLEQFIPFAKMLLLRGELIQSYWRYLVSESLKEEIPEELSSIIELVPQQVILEALKTIDTSYIAATLCTTSFKGKRMNSAKFCYKVLEYLKENFTHRFSIYEQTDITRIDLYKTHSVLEHSHGKVTTQDVILCTNAYKDFSIWDQIHRKPFTKLHDAIMPRIGYLAAFPNTSPDGYALGFLNQRETFKEVPFWYFSHAPHPNHNPNHSCVLGGPEFGLNEAYSTEWVETKKKLSLDLITRFLKITFKEPPSTFPFFWYGWMGYTPDGLRWVGPDADHPHLWYNLACNGIGIVPALAAAKRIATLMALK